MRARVSNHYPTSLFHTVSSVHSRKLRETHKDKKQIFNRGFNTKALVKHSQGVSASVEP